MSNWEWKKLQDVSIQYGEYGLSVPSTTFDGVRYLRITDITDEGNLNDESVSADIETIDDFYKLQNGDILFARTGATVGKTFVYEDKYGECVFAGYLIRYRPNQKLILPRFLFYVTHSPKYYEWIKSNQKTAAQPNISAKLYNALLVPVPPLAEQKRIVKTLDEKFSKIDKLKNAAETNLKNAREIFNAELKSKLNVENENLPQGWELKNLGDVCSFKNGFAFQSKLFRTNGFPIIRISNIQSDGIDFDNMVYFNPLDYKVDFEKYKVFPNDILIAMSGGTTGKIGVNRTNEIFYLNQRVGAFRENEKRLDHWFLYYFLKTKSKESLEISAGSAQPNLSTEQINNFQIPLPPLSEQKRIVAHLDKFSEKVKRLEEIYRRTVADCEELKKSILKKTFEGDSRSSRE